MNKKDILLVFFVLTIIVSIRYFDWEDQNTVTEKISAISESGITGLPLNKNVAPVSNVVPPKPRSWPKAGPFQDIVVNERKLQEDQNRLLDLINQYDQNLHDPLKRKEIEQLVLKTSESYKKEVLAKVRSLQQNTSSLE